MKKSTQRLKSNSAQTTLLFFVKGLPDEELFKADSFEANLERVKKLWADKFAPPELQNLARDEAERRMKISLLTGLQNNSRPEPVNGSLKPLSNDAKNHIKYPSRKERKRNAV